MDTRRFYLRPILLKTHLSEGIPMTQPLQAQAGSAAQAAPRAPSRLRMSALVFCFIYPLVTGLLYLLLPLMRGAPLYQTTLIICPLVVLSMVFAIMPLITKRLRHLL
jgi:antibiotic biosynthesis monooxygenase (ABM) superfamily enzyme